MTPEQESLEAIQDIRRMMERSSRFISLSGWSGVAAGLSALGGAWAASCRLASYRETLASGNPGDGPAVSTASLVLLQDLIRIAAITFFSALVLAFLFTYIRSRRHGIPLWDRTVQRLTWNTVLPMFTGGLVIIRAMQWHYFELVVPGCLIFYGLALVNASKYTLGEIRYLGYGQLILGLLSLWISHYGLYFWAAGFGVLHIVYGSWMWWKYERGTHSLVA